MSLVTDLSMEDYLCFEAIDYKNTFGQSGEQLNIKECPKCLNSKWKLYIGLDSGLGKCHACDSGFNKWKYIEAHTGLSGKELYRHIASVKEALGAPSIRIKPKTVVTAEIEVGELELPQSLALPTPDGQNALYLEKRGITAEYSEYFHLRYCLDGWHRYTKPDGSRGGQNCANRIIIPVFDLEGKLVTFQARDVTGEAEIRYLFPSGLPGTGRYLYNGHNAYALGVSEVIVNEGPFDVAATKRVIDRFPEMKGIVPVGTFGKHLSINPDSADQFGAFMALKKRGLKRVTIMWDGEHEAFSAALSAAEALKKRGGLELFIAMLPEGKDPDEADQIEVYEAWANAIPVNAVNLAKYRVRNPYKRKEIKGVDGLGELG